MSDKVVLKAPDKYTSNVTFADISQNKINISEQNNTLTLDHIGSNPKDSTLILTCNTNSTFDIDIYPPVQHYMNLIRLCESNDDYANFCTNFDGDSIHYEVGDVVPHLTSDCMTPIDNLPSPSIFQCINPGTDGSIDRFLETNIGGYWYNRMDFDSKGTPDSLAVIPSFENMLAIYPGRDSLGRRRCNSSPVTLPKDWNADRNGDGIKDSYIECVPQNVNVSDISTNLNVIYNQIGINVIVNDRGYDTINYNSNNSKINSIYELAYILAEKYNQSVNSLSYLDTTTCFFIDTLNSSLGTTLTNGVLGFNSFFINTKAHLGNLFRERTISHEFGHAAFHLKHPDDKRGVLYDKLSRKEQGDKYNFMNSGGIWRKTVKNIHEYRVRKYQWKKILN